MVVIFTDSDSWCAHINNAMRIISNFAASVIRTVHNCIQSEEYTVSYERTKSQPVVKHVVEPILLHIHENKPLYYQKSW